MPQKLDLLLTNLAEHCDKAMGDISILEQWFPKLQGPNIDPSLQDKFAATSRLCHNLAVLCQASNIMMVDGKIAYDTAPRYITEGKTYNMNEAKLAARDLKESLPLTEDNAVEKFLKQTGYTAMTDVPLGPCITAMIRQFRIQLQIHRDISQYLT